MFRGQACSRPWIMARTLAAAAVLIGSTGVHVAFGQAAPTPPPAAPTTPTKPGETDIGRVSTGPGQGEPAPAVPSATTTRDAAIECASTSPW